MKRQVFGTVWVLLLLLTLLVGQEATGQVPAAGQEPPLTFDLQLGDLTVEGDPGTFEVDLDLEEVSPGISILHLRLSAPSPATPPELTLRWKVPSVEIDGYWNPNIAIDKVGFWRNTVDSRSTNNAPVITLLNGADRNRLTFAVSDALRPVQSRCYLREEDAFFHCSVRLFEEKAPATERYSVEVRFDARDVAYPAAIADVADWWAAQEGYQPSPVPDAARWPMYSTWYSFHQNLDPAAVMAELEIAKRLGYEAVIVDDGWQTLDSSRGYAYTGDWEPERIPDMHGFVDRVHDLGMDFILWYSLPFMGENAEGFEAFRGKYLWYWEGQGAWVLDPRYPEVRELIISTYEKALTEWNLDGFKIDFIDRFVPDEETVLTAEDGRDFASVDAAVDRLMTDVMERLREIKPDIMIEFRQRYIGPLMRKYGNMFRAVDCPNNAVANRVETMDLRLLSGDTAVHSDMFMWHPDDTVEHAALQILNVLFSVPQLSVRLTQIPEEHLEMVRFWTGYWRDNREVLLDGALRPTRPAALYPIIKARGDGKTIVGLYEDMVVPVGGAPPATGASTAGGTSVRASADVIDVINAKPGTTVVLQVENDLGSRQVSTYDVTGNLIDQSTRRITAGVHAFGVPASGLLRIE
jgi:alpha-galactosidase